MCVVCVCVCVRVRVVTEFTHGAMDRRIDPSWWPHCAISRSSQCFYDWFNKGRGMCYPVCVVMHIYKKMCC